MHLRTLVRFVHSSHTAILQLIFTVSDPASVSFIRFDLVKAYPGVLYGLTSHMNFHWVQIQSLNYIQTTCYCHRASDDKL